MYRFLFKPFTQMFSFKGRATRMDIWIFNIFWIIAINIGVLFIDLLPNVISTLFSILIIMWSIANISLVVRRLHDRDKSGWNFWFCLIPIAGPIAVFIVLFCLDGLPGSNRFGPDPKHRHKT